jgi:phosphoenolpyruvate synthase/pyruvate phosphate dikinase
VKTSFPDAGRRGAPQNAQKLENEFRDVQDIDFTVEEGKLYFLQTRSQTRSAKRAPLAAVRIAMDLVKKGLIATRRNDPPKLISTMLARSSSKATRSSSFSGRTAHAAVVVREMGKTCLIGCRALRVDALGERLNSYPITSISIR